MAGRFISPNSFLDPGIFNHAAQQTRPGHEDVVTPRLGQMKRCLCLCLRILQIPIVEMKVSIIKVNASNP